MHSIATPALDVIHLVILSELLYGRYKQKQVCNCFRFKKKIFWHFHRETYGIFVFKGIDFSIRCYGKHYKFTNRNQRYLNVNKIAKYRK